MRAPMALPDLPTAEPSATGFKWSMLGAAGRLSQAEKVADKLRRAVADKPFETTAGALPITTSLGIAVFDGEEKASTVARRADLALYTAKENGRNRYESA